MPYPSPRWLVVLVLFVVALAGRVLPGDWPRGFPACVAGVLRVRWCELVASKVAT